MSFFEVVLPHLLAEKGAAANRLGGVVQFYLIDDPEAAWYADLAHPDLPVVRGTHEWPDLNIYIAEHHLGPLVCGDLDVDAAWEAETLAADGDRDLLNSLADVFSSGRSWLEALAARSSS